MSQRGSFVPVFNISDISDEDIILAPELDPSDGPYAVNSTSIFSTAVYYDQVAQSTVIYCVSIGAGGDSDLFKYNFGSGKSALTLLFDANGGNFIAPIVAGSADVVYFSTYSNGNSLLFRLNSSFHQTQIASYPNSALAIGDLYRGLAISTSGDRLVTTSSTDQIDFTTTGVYMVYPPFYGIQTVLEQSFFAGAWFTCGDKLVSPVPQTTPEYGAKCANNGFVEQVLYKGYYMFTEADAASYVIKNAPAHCTFDWACSALADLPPYSCSRTIRPSFFEYIGTAYANTALLMTILLFLFALILTRLAKDYPPEGTNVHPPEVEMTPMDNPMRV